MNAVFSSSFMKAVHKLSGKTLESVRRVIVEVEQAKRIEEITDCIKLSGYKYAYRIRIGDRRAFFIFHVHVANDKVVFEYLVSRGQAYSKKFAKNLRDKDV